MVKMRSRRVPRPQVKPQVAPSELIEQELDAVAEQQAPMSLLEALEARAGRQLDGDDLAEILSRLTIRYLPVISLYEEEEEEEIEEEEE